METVLDVVKKEKSINRSVFSRGGRSRVLLREPEICAECNKVYISLYPLKCCNDHDGLDKI